jgi:hypothetical protein
MRFTARRRPHSASYREMAEAVAIPAATPAPDAMPLLSASRGGVYKAAQMVS